MEASSQRTLQGNVETCADKIKEWLDHAGLVLAESKTEIMLMNRKRTENLSFRIGTQLIAASPSLKYLGVTLDTGKNFREHIKNSTNKGIRTMAALAGLMTNLGPAKKFGRKLYYSILESVVLYGAPVWAEEARTSQNRKLLVRTQKLGLGRVASAYRTVPLETLCTITGTLPWEFLVQERREIFHWESMLLGRNNVNRNRPVRTLTTRIREGDFTEYEGGGWRMGQNNLSLDTAEYDEGRDPEETEENRNRGLKKWIRKKARDKSIELWRNKWSEGRYGVWTRGLIPDPEDWRKKGRDLGFWRTQFLTGHGVFNVFRHKIGKAASDECWFHVGVPDSVEHTLIHCSRWDNERGVFFSKIGLNPDNCELKEVWGRIDKDEETWEAFGDFSKEVLTEKTKEERRREQEGLDAVTMRLTDDEDMEIWDPGGA